MGVSTVTAHQRMFTSDSGIAKMSHYESRLRCPCIRYHCHAVPQSGIDRFMRSHRCDGGGMRHRCLTGGFRQHRSSPAGLCRRTLDLVDRVPNSGLCHGRECGHGPFRMYRKPMPLAVGRMVIGPTDSCGRTIRAHRGIGGYDGHEFKGSRRTRVCGCRIRAESQHSCSSQDRPPNRRSS